MCEFKFKDDLVAKEKCPDTVNNENITLCVAGSSSDVTFSENAWHGVANMLIAGCRTK